MRYIVAIGIGLLIGAFFQFMAMTDAKAEPSSKPCFTLAMDKENTRRLNLKHGQPIEHLFISDTGKMVTIFLWWPGERVALMTVFENGCRKSIVTMKAAVMAAIIGVDEYKKANQAAKQKKI